MTYRDLLNLLTKMNSETLDSDLTIKVPGDEFFPAQLHFAGDDEVVLDPGHPYFEIR